MCLHSHDCIPVSFDLKSAFFSLCLEPCINTEIQSYIFYVRSQCVPFNQFLTLLNTWLRSRKDVLNTLSKTVGRMHIMLFFLVFFCLYSVYRCFTVLCDELKTSDDCETRELRVCEWASEEFTSCLFLLLWLEQSSCYAASWRERKRQREVFGWMK